jgi:hypothetical protein
LAASSATCGKKRQTTQQIEDSGTDIKVMNWTTSVACANGDRFGIAAWINGGWYIIAEDCNDEGSTLEPGTGSSSGGTVAELIDTTIYASRRHAGASVRHAIHRTQEPAAAPIP